jgi:hypothetical protein
MALPSVCFCSTLSSPCSLSRQCVIPDQRQLSVTEPSLGRRSIPRHHVTGLIGAPIFTALHAENFPVRAVNGPTIPLQPTVPAQRHHSAHAPSPIIGSPGHDQPLKPRSRCDSCLARHSRLPASRSPPRNVVVHRRQAGAEAPPQDGTLGHPHAAEPRSASDDDAALAPLGFLVLVGDQPSIASPAVRVRARQRCYSRGNQARSSRWRWAGTLHLIGLGTGRAPRRSSRGGCISSSACGSKRGTGLPPSNAGSIVRRIAL